MQTNKANIQKMSIRRSRFRVHIGYMEFKGYNLKITDLQTILISYT